LYKFIYSVTFLPLLVNEVVCLASNSEGAVEAFVHPEGA